METSMNDLISRQAAINAILHYIIRIPGYMSNWGRKLTAAIKEDLMDEINAIPHDQQWIPFKTRPLTEDEKTEHPEWSFIIDGEIPEEGQRILVNVAYKGHEAVQMDEWGWNGEGVYLESEYDIGTEVTAWMPLPEPYKDEEGQ